MFRRKILKYKENINKLKRLKNNNDRKVKEKKRKLMMNIIRLKCIYFYL